jgi:hypothetical protein
VTIARRVARLLPGRSDYAEVPYSWRPDVLAGLTVGVVALPLALAFGVSAGAGAAAGLVTAVVAGHRGLHARYRRHHLLATGSLCVWRVGSGG